MVSNKPLKVAVIGSGIAGLSVAWLLGQKHQVTLFEKHSTPGMGAFNLAYTDGDIKERIDVPIRAFNSCYYKNIIALYRHLGVEFIRTDHSATYTVASDFTSGDGTYFGYRYIRVANKAFPVFTDFSKINLKSLTIAKDAALFLWQSRVDQKRGETKCLTIEQYLNSKSYSEQFKHEVIYPSFAAIGTCSYAATKRYPADTIIDFLASGMLFDGIWRAKYGADDPIDRLLNKVNELKCSTSVVKIRRDGTKVVVEEEGGKKARYDHVIIASQANQAAKLLTRNEKNSAELLARVPYEQSEVVVHRDRRFAPLSAKDRAPVNFLVDRTKHAPMASICLNDLYPSLANAHALYQTWNPLFEPVQDTIVGRSIFERPVVTLDSLEAMQSLQSMQRKKDRQIWFCGSYAMPGIPLLESGLQSSIQIAEQFGCAIPWKV